MNKTCKIKPTKNDCSLCHTANEFYDFELHCDSCMDKEPVCELLSLGYNRSVGEWAMVLYPNGTIERVELYRVCDVQDK